MTTPSTSCQHIGGQKTCFKLWYWKATRLWAVTAAGRVPQLLMAMSLLQDDHLQMVQTKLEPLRSIFPPEEHGSAVVVSAASTPGVQQQTAAAGDSGHHTRKMCHSDTGKAPTSVPGCSEHMGGSKTAPADGERTHRIRGKPNPSRKYPDQNMNSNLESKATKHHSWLQRITGCLRPS